MTAIWVQPDAEFFERLQRIVFEIPGELHREIMNPDITDEERRGFFGRAYREFALPAILAARKNPMRYGFEVLDRQPLEMGPHDVQEDGGDIVERTLKGVPRATISKAALRDSTFWRISVWVKVRRVMFERFREVKGPKDGFEANDELPEWMAHKQLIYDNSKRSG